MLPQRKRPKIIRLMKNNLPQTPVLFKARYEWARKSILLLFGLSLFNMINVIFGGTEFYLYAASIPYSMAFEASYLTGRLPNEYYSDWPETLPFYDMSEFWIRIAIALVILLIYLGVFFLTKKVRPFIFIPTCIFVIVDSLYRLVYFEVDAYLLIEFTFAAYFVCSLIVGIINGYRLKKMPAQEEFAAEIPLVSEEQTE